jgi:NhaP-type Na+/H+ and K+/H+ antiporter
LNFFAKNFFGLPFALPLTTIHGNLDSDFKTKCQLTMPSNNLHSERISLQIQLQQKNEKFDYAIEHEDDCESAKLIYREIKELKTRLKEMTMVEEAN